MSTYNTMGASTNKIPKIQNQALVSNYHATYLIIVIA